jgi:hypothetical protein
MLDIDQSTITGSEHYSPIGNTGATIEFCVRVDYNYLEGGVAPGESVNLFHETKR